MSDYYPPRRMVARQAMANIGAEPGLEVDRRRSYCGFHRTTPVAIAVQQNDSIQASKELHSLFKELLDFTLTETKPVNIGLLLPHIARFFRSDEELNNETNRHLKKIKDCCYTSRAILEYFVQHEFIGYLNYSLLKVFQQIIKSPLLDKRINEYKKDHKCFLELPISKIYDAFKQCPDFSPIYPAGIPEFTVHSRSEWDGKSMLDLHRFFEECFTDTNCVDQLMITKISHDHVSFAVLPNVARSVVEYLTNDDVAMSMENKQISVEISDELMKYKEFMTGSAHQGLTSGSLETDLASYSSQDSQLRVDVLEEELNLKQKEIEIQHSMFKRVMMELDATKDSQLRVDALEDELDLKQKETEMQRSMLKSVMMELDVTKESEKQLKMELHDSKESNEQLTRMLQEQEQEHMSSFKQLKKDLHDKEESWKQLTMEMEDSQLLIDSLKQLKKNIMHDSEVSKKILTKKLHDSQKFQKKLLKKLREHIVSKKQLTKKLHNFEESRKRLYKKLQERKEKLQTTEEFQDELSKELHNTKDELRKTKKLLNEEEDASVNEENETSADKSPLQENTISTPELETGHPERLQLEKYPLHSVPRGCCIIINNDRFTGQQPLPPRPGSLKDVEDLRSLFGELLGFEVSTLSNTTEIEMMLRLQEIANIDHSYYSALFVIAMSHGDKGGIIFTHDCKAVRISSIASLFTASRCPSLADKPKVFILQACQGNKSSKPILLHYATDNTVQNDCGDLTLIDADTTVNEADFLFAFATIHGRLAMRDSLQGSWYIQALVYTLKSMSCAGGNSFTGVLDEVNNRLLLHYDSLQISTYKSTLRKQLYLSRVCQQTLSFASCTNLSIDDSKFAKRVVNPNHADLLMKIPGKCRSLCLISKLSPIPKRVVEGSILMYNSEHTNVLPTENWEMEPLQEITSSVQTESGVFTSNGSGPLAAFNTDVILSAVRGLETSEAAAVSAIFFPFDIHVYMDEMTSNTTKYQIC